MSPMKLFRVSCRCGHKLCVYARFGPHARDRAFTITNSDRCPDCRRAHWHVRAKVEQHRSRKRWWNPLTWALAPYWGAPDK